MKLIGDSAVLPVAFATLNGSSHATQNVLSTYYDTPDGHLWRRGFTLRLRKKRDAHELTLKQEGGNGLKRGEWTSVVTKPEVDIRLLPQDAPRAEIGVIFPEEVEPRFCSDIERTKTIFKTGDAVLEVSLDMGRIVAVERQMPVAELEFELLSGSVADMLTGVRSIMQNNDLSISTQSKASRGMDLLKNAPPPAVRATKPDLDASDTIEEAIAKVIAVTAMQTMGNLAAAVDARDPEGVHQLRVSLRRLRSALLVFRDQLGSWAGDLNTEARRALRQLGPVRDFDVFLSETLPPVVAGNPDEPGLACLGETAVKRQEEAYRDVRKLLADRRFNGFLLDLLTVAEGGGLVVEGADQSLIPTARRTLAKQHKRVMKAGETFDLLTEAQRHEVRIALKKLRYACDYFQIVFPRQLTRPYLKRLVALQDYLGRLNDMTVAGQITRELAAGDANAALGAALVKGWYNHHLLTAEPHMRRAWRKFAGAEPFWR